MKKIFYAPWFLIFLSFICLASAAEDLPVPADAAKVREKSFNFGPTTSVTRSYETFLSQNKVSAFFSREMRKLGWSEEKKGFFRKGNEFAVITVVPVKMKNNKTRFSVTASQTPSKEDILAQRKAKPDKVDFMPVYPGSEQLFLWEIPFGASASYETDSDIKDVVFFYKSGMLNYGWSLSRETPITTAKPVDCPDCDKGLVQFPGSSSGSLIFKRGSDETCIIRLYQVSPPTKAPQAQEAEQALSQEILNAVPRKTKILVTYNDNKKINP